MLKKISRGTILVIAANIMLIAVAITFISYYENVKTTLDLQLNNYLLKTAQQNAQTVEKQLVQDLNTVHSIAKALSSQDSLNDNQMISMLIAYNSNSTYKRVGIIDRNGKTVTSDGLEMDLSDRDFFINGLAGKDTISKTIFDRNDGKAINVLASPIVNAQGSVSSVLFVTYDSDKYEKVLSMTWFAKDETTFLTTSEGEILFDKNGDSGKNISSRISKDYTPLNTQSVLIMQTDMKWGKQGIFEYSSDDINGYVVYTPIKFENWYCVSALPNNDMQGEKIIKYGGLMTLLVTAFVLGFAAVVFLCFRKNYSDLKKLNKNIALTEERYRIVAEQSNSVIFDYKLSDKSIYISTIFEKKFGYVAPSGDFPNSMLAKGIISSEDVDIFNSAFNACLQGAKYNETEVRIKAYDGKYIWCLFRMTTLFDEHHKPYRILGKILDIDKAKRKTAILTERSNRDGMTGFYNKDAAKEMITSFMSNRESELSSAMILVDIDNFKLVNDRLGHQMGDRCIKEIARTISDVFLSGDVLARVGGDEFTVFIKEVMDEEDACAKGKLLCQALGTCSVMDNNGVSYRVTASVGVAVLQNSELKQSGGNEAKLYERLFKQADIAMYYSKKRGKNQCTLYTKEKEQALFDGREFMLSLTGEIEVPNDENKENRENKEE